MSRPPLTGERTVPGVRSENYWFRRHEAAYRWAMRAARGAIVDAGCGEGYGAAMLARRGWVLGLDLDPRAVGAAARRYPGASFGVADLCRLPVASADTIVAMQVIEHLWCPADFVAACARALRPGGLLLVSTPSAETFPTGLNPSHAHEYTTAELVGLLGTAFATVELLGLRHGAALRRLDRALGGSVQRRLISTPYDDLPRTARARLRATRARHFRIGAEPSASLDLLAICRDARRLPSAP